MAHHENSGLQSHSVGDTYPWSVVVEENTARNHGKCVVVNLITGERTETWGYYITPNPALPGSIFENANRFAEEGCKRRKARDNAAKQSADPVYDRPDYRSPRSPLRVENIGREFTILLPVYNYAGKPFPATYYREFENFLFKHSCGFTQSCAVGCWRDDTGEIIRDHSCVYKIAGSLHADFLAALSGWASKFEQTCLYVAESSPHAYLVYA